MCTFVGALKASTERFEGLKVRGTPRVVRMGFRFVDIRSVLVMEGREGGIVRTQEVIKRGWRI